MNFLKWMGKFPTSSLNELHQLIQRIPGSHKIKILDDGELLLISDNGIDMGIAIKSNRYLALTLR